MRAAVPPAAQRDGGARQIDVKLNERLCGG
jgi:hypothetical protein